MFQKLFADPIYRLRVTGFIEGLTFLLLLFVGMPLKYGLGQDMAVRVLGPIHGAAFLYYVYLVFTLSSQHKWPFWQVTAKLLIASILPFGTFYTDKKILSRM